MDKRISGLYAVTPDLADSETLFAKVDAALRGGARVVQYRSKSPDAALRLRQAKTLAGMCRRHAAVFIVNDSIDLAAAVSADGVHLGRDDGDPMRARAVLGAGGIVGVSCYNEIERARAAVSEGADYVAFGSFFPSSTKSGTVRAAPALLRLAAAELPVPVVAIGGIRLPGASQLIAEGADAVAVVSALFDADDVEAQARRFADLFQPSARNERPA